MELKYCKYCTQLLPIENFSKSKNIKSGYKNICKNCHSNREKARRHQNLEKYNEQRQKYRNNNREKVNQQKRENYKKNKEKITAKRKLKRQCPEWRAKEAKRLREYHNRSEVHKLRKRCRSRVSFPGWSKEEVNVYLLSTFYLKYRRLPLKSEETHIDHIVPLSWATTSEEIEKLKKPENIQLLLALDNLKKNDYIVDYREGELL